MGALTRLDGLRSGDGPVKLLQRLPWRQQAEQRGTEQIEPPRPVQEPAPAAAVAPTHVVHRGVAHAVGRAALHIGREAVNGRRTIVVDDRHQAVSRSHCELVRRDGELRLKDSSRFGTFVNEKRVSGEAVLRSADIIRVGSPGEELQVITIGAHDGS